MGKFIRDLWSPRLSVIASISLLMLCFQNMTPVGEVFDIRDVAPERPAGFGEFQYFPSEFGGHSADALGSEILNHNFGSMVRTLEMTFDSRNWGVKRTSIKGGSSLNQVGSEGPSWRMGLLGGDQMGLIYEDDFEFRMIYSAGRNNLLVSLDKSLTARSNVSLKHTTEDRVSTVNFVYKW